MHPVIYCSLPIQLPSQPRNPLTEFGLSLQASLSDQMSMIDRDLARDDETKDDFFKKVLQLLLHNHTVHVCII